MSGPGDESRIFSGFSHLGPEGQARMVDTGVKPESPRLARAEGCVRMKRSTVELIRNQQLAKGDVLAVARVAAICGAKQTASLIPLCHPLGLDAVSVDFGLGEDFVTIRATARVTGRTGVEMEALVAVSVAALTLYDMCKSVDREMTIEAIRLIEKKGGASGHFLRQETID
jgi:cyclic pyranopterin monophosphate synthase